MSDLSRFVDEDGLVRVDRHTLNAEERELYDATLLHFVGAFGAEYRVATAKSCREMKLYAIAKMNLPPELFAQYEDSEEMPDVLSARAVLYRATGEV